MRTTLHVHSDRDISEMVGALSMVLAEDEQSLSLTLLQREAIKDIHNAALVAQRREMMHQESREGWPF